MRVGGARQNSATITIPGMGSRSIPAIALGYGISVAYSTGEARNQRTFYPFIKTSGQWYIEAHFSEKAERDSFHMWIMSYIKLITDPMGTPPPPMAVSVPSRGFMKSGYPTSSVEFSDAVGTAVYRSTVQFTSASDPVGQADGSQFSVASRYSGTSSTFYPGGNQSSATPITAVIPPALDQTHPDVPWV